MNNTKNNKKKSSLLDDFNELEEYSKKNYEMNYNNLESDISESHNNTINADTEQSVSKINSSRQQQDLDFMYDINNNNNNSEQYNNAKQTKKLLNNKTIQMNSNSSSVCQTSNNNNSVMNRNHAPQIIDEDTEHFKVKIEHLLNVFKTDAISEFMGMKRSMLEDQRNQVKNQTERYLAMYEDKHKEQAETQEKLEESIRINNILKERLEKMSGITQKAKSRFHTSKSLQYFFNAIKNYKKYKIEQKKKKRLAEMISQKNLKLRVFNSFIKVCKESKHENDLKTKEKEHLIEIDEISNRFNKEMSLLKEQLLETQQQLQQIHVTKESMQENLKKAFMRGVCALNFEAMNAIQGNQSGFNADTFLNSLEGQTQLPQYRINNVSQVGIPSTFSQSIVTQNPSQQININQSTQQILNQNENNLMQQIVKQNPSNFNSMLINPTADINSYSNNNNNQQQQQLQQQQQQSNLSTQNITSSNQFNNNLNTLTNTNNQYNPQTAYDTLEQERISQIEFLKRELESIQKIAGNNNNNNTLGQSSLQMMNNEQNQQFDSNKYQQQQEQEDEDQYNNVDYNMTQNNNNINQQKKIVIFQDSKLESKDHRWKNAPVVGLSTNNNKSILNSSIHNNNNNSNNNNINNKENDFLQNSSSLPSFTDQSYPQSHPQEEECKVIRVNTQSKEFSNTTTITNKFDKTTIKPNAKPPVKEPMPQKSFPINNSSSVQSKITSHSSLNGSNSSKTININNNSTVKSNIGTPSKTNNVKSSTKR